MKNLILSIFLFCAGVVVAQEEEYIITPKNDTIRGKVVMSKYSDLIQQVTVKNGKNKSTFKVYQVKTIKNNKGIFHTLKIQEKYQFARLVREGYLSYYMYGGDASSASLKFDTPLLYKKTTEHKEVPNISFRKQISAFLSDCEVTNRKFETGEYSRNKLEEVIDDYNRCVADRTTEINAKHVVAKQKNSKAVDFNELRASISKSTKIQNVNEVIEMILDVESKLRKEEAIPSYLIGALKDKLLVEPALSTKLLQIIE